MALVELLSEEYLAHLTAEELAEYERCLEVLASEADPFAVLGYEPTCLPREEARRAGRALPEPCGRCPQELFHAATEDKVLYGGAAGGGKTKALTMDNLRDAVRYPGMWQGIFRRNYPELYGSVVRELAKVGFARKLGASYNGNEHRLTFENGSVIVLGYLETLVDATRYQGMEFQKVSVDERTLIIPGLVDIVCERLRSSNPSIPVLGLRCTANPGGASHGEVRREFIDATDHGAGVVVDQYGQTVRFIPAKVVDNPHVDAGYLARLQAIPDPLRRRAMLDGDWDSFSGQFFGEWSRTRHVFEQPFPIPAGWQRYRGVDWGFAKPWAVEWVALDEDGRGWVYREMYDTQVGEHDQAKRIVAAETTGEDEREGVTGVGDPAMWARRGDAESIASAYAKEGCALKPANNDRVGGWQRVHTFLGDGPACLYHRGLGWETCPKLHIFANCTELIRTLPNLPFDKTKAEDVDTDAEDHAPDALRYALMAVGSVASWDFGDDARVRRPEGWTPPQESLGPYTLPRREGNPWDVG